MILFMLEITDYLLHNILLQILDLPPRLSFLRIQICHSDDSRNVPIVFYFAMKRIWQERRARERCNGSFDFQLILNHHELLFHLNN